MIQTKRYHLYLYAIIGSILLSLIALQTKDPINPDGILYLRTASAYLHGGLASAMKLYNWPFYSLLIAWFSQFSHLSLLHAAQLLNIFFLCMLVTVYVALIKELGGNYTTQFFAVITILIYPVLAHQRVYIIRDFGYWAFSLLGIWQLLRYNHFSRWRYVLGFWFSMLVATAFRIEGAIFLMFAPSILFFIGDFSWQTRFNRALKFFSVAAFFAIATLLWVFTKPHHQPIQFGRVPELISQLSSGWQLLLDTFHNKSTLLGQAILDVYSVENASTILLGGMIAVFLMAVITTLTPLYSILSGYGIYRNLLPTTRSNKIILLTFIVINVIITSLFVGQQQFLSNRYVIALSLLFMLWVPFVLHSLYDVWIKAPGKHWVFSIVCLFMLATAVGDVVRFGYSKAYITEAAVWIKQNTEPSATLYTNSKEIAFYAEKPGPNWEQDFIVTKPFSRIYDNTWRHYDYVALLIKHDQLAEKAKLLAILNQQPVQYFQNKRADAVLIFRIYGAARRT